MSRHYENRGHEQAAHDAQFSNPVYDHSNYDNSPRTSSYKNTAEAVPLGTEAEDKELFDQIDQLRRCRVDEYIDLPQIAVVGDQSAGKSSVLEALTNIPFQRSTIKCTRFATQITLRRADDVKNTVTILPHKECHPDEKLRLEKFKQSFSDAADFHTIFAEAMKTIFPNSEHDSFLSKNILSIEVSGPELPHLTVVDLPGLIHAAAGNIDIRDKEAIDSLAKSYMENERTIILLVISCTTDIASQIGLTYVRRFDKEGVRSLGVITKPDTTTYSTAREKEFIDLAAGKDPKNVLRLGWHVLRNRAHGEDGFSPAEREATEDDFFRSHKNWKDNLEPSQLGIREFRTKLSTQLRRHIAAEAIKVQADIENELEKSKEGLLRLGDDVDTPEEMRAKFSKCCGTSLRVTQAAVQGHGMNPSGIDFFTGTKMARNFRSRVVKENQKFALQMENWGSACHIIDDSEFANRKINNTFKMENWGSVPEFSKTDFLQKEVIPLVEENPGKELSVDTNPHHVYRLFQDHSRNWPGHAERHVKEILKICDEFLREVLNDDRIWPKQVRNRIWIGFIQKAVNSRLISAEKELDQLKVDRKRFITPFESEFKGKYYEWKGVKQNPYQASSVLLHDQKYEELLKKMLLLYESNLKTFITNTVVQVIERHLADGLEEIFHEQRVASLTDKEIQTLIQDDHEIRNERQKLKAKVEILEKGLEICKQIGMRPDLDIDESKTTKPLAPDQPPISSVRRKPTSPTANRTFTSAPGTPSNTRFGEGSPSSTLSGDTIFSQTNPVYGNGPVRSQVHNQTSAMPNRPVMGMSQQSPGVGGRRAGSEQW